MIARNLFGMDPLQQKAYWRWQKVKSTTHSNIDPEFQPAIKTLLLWPAWRDDFARFVADVGWPPDELHLTLRRYDERQGFVPGNVFWGTIRAPRVSIDAKVEIGGEVLSLRDWADRIGIARKAMRRRYNDGVRGEQLLRKDRKRC